MVYLFNYLSSFSPSRLFSNRDTVIEWKYPPGHTVRQHWANSDFLALTVTPTRTRPNKATLEAETPRTGSKEEDRDETLKIKNGLAACKTLGSLVRYLGR